MKRYIKSSYYDEYSEETIETSGNIYGYEIESTMTYNTIMFCHEDEDYLVRRIKKIYDLLLNSKMVSMRNTAIRRVSTLLMMSTVTWLRIRKPVVG
jgi:hypothetical protein